MISCGLKSVREECTVIMEPLITVIDSNYIICQLDCNTFCISMHSLKSIQIIVLSCAGHQPDLEAKEP